MNGYGSGDSVGVVFVVVVEVCVVIIFCLYVLFVWICIVKCY